MKKFIAILVIMFIGTSAYSQYLVDGLKWNNTNGGSDYWRVNLQRNFTYKVEGDTTIVGVGYKLIKKNFPDLNQEWNTVFYAREDNRKWYFLMPNDSSELLMYDFSLETGDTFNIPTYYNIPIPVVKHGDTVLENGETRKYLMLGLDPYYPYNNDLWIEGIGSVTCHLDLPCLYSYMVDFVAVCLCASYNDDLLFTVYPELNCYDTGYFVAKLNNIDNNDFKTTIYPNPAKSEINISSENIIKSIEIYNPLGQRVYQTKVNSKTKYIDVSFFTNGIYIIGVNTDKGYIKKKLIKN